MIAIIQRVNKAYVSVENRTIQEIKKGFLVLFGIHKDDQTGDIDYIIHKIIRLRIFGDENNKANLSIKAINGGILLVPQFTLMANTRKGNRPSFTNAADIKKGYEFGGLFYERLKEKHKDTKYGVFQAYMQVGLVNDGPFTIIMDSFDRHKARRSS